MTLSTFIPLPLFLSLMLYHHSAYKSSAADSLLAERSRIDSSHNMTDDIIEFVLLPTY